MDGRILRKRLRPISTTISPGFSRIVELIEVGRRQTFIVFLICTFIISILLPFLAHTRVFHGKKLHFRDIGGFQSAEFSQKLLVSSRNDSGTPTLLYVCERVPLFDSRGSDLRSLRVLEALSKAGFAMDIVTIQKHVEVQDTHRQAIHLHGVRRVLEGWSTDIVRHWGRPEIVVAHLWYWNWPLQLTSADLVFDLFAHEADGPTVIVLTDDVHHVREAQGNAKVDRVKDVRQHESWVYHRADAVFTVTEEDANRLIGIFRPATPVGVFPFTFIVPEKATPMAGRGQDDILFVGSYNKANNDGLSWFLKYCWKEIHQRAPKVVLKVVGNVKCNSFGIPNVICEGQQNSLAPFLAKAMLLVSPVQSTGINTKNVLAMANAVPIVTTTAGAEGLHLRGLPLSMRQLIVVEMTEFMSFAHAVVRLLEDEPLRHAIGSKLASIVHENFAPWKAQYVAKGLKTWWKGCSDLPMEIPAEAPFDKRRSHRKIDVAIHAQKISRGVDNIVGSDITTSHLARAFEQSGRAASVRRFSKVNTRTAKKLFFDFALVEGWAPDVPLFIQSVRYQNPSCVVAHWCLSLWNINDVLQYDVDIFFTNSKPLVPLLNRHAPAKFLSLAAPRVLNVFSGCVERTGVVYVGHPAFGKKTNLAAMLNEASSFDLSIYGHSTWVNTEYRRFYRGQVPKDSLEKLYISAKVVLACTDNTQASAGMINNRIFEAAASGAAIISDHFQALENMFGSSVFYHKVAGDTRRALCSVYKGRSTIRMRRKVRGIATRNEYTQRAIEILDFVNRSFVDYRRTQKPVPHSANDTQLLILKYLEESKANKSKEEAANLPLGTVVSCSNVWQSNAARQLHIWERISKRHIEQAVLKHRKLIRYRVVSNRLYRNGFDVKWCRKKIKQCEVGFRSRMHAVESMLLRLIHLMGMQGKLMPDLDFVMNMESKPLSFEEDPVPLPIFSVWRTDQHRDILFPDEAFTLFEFLDGSPAFVPQAAMKSKDKALDIYNLENIRKFGQTSLQEPVQWNFTLAQYQSSSKKWIWLPSQALPLWTERRQQFFWRGSPTGGHYNTRNWNSFPRSKLVLLSSEHPDVLNCSFVEIGPQVSPDAAESMLRHITLAPKATLVQHAQYQYLLSIDGNAAPNRFHKILPLGSAVFRFSSPYKGHYDFLLEPGLHFVELESIAIEEFRQILIMHGKHGAYKLENIAKEATSLFHNFLSVESIDCYLLEILNAYSKKMDYCPQPDAESTLL